MFSNRPDNLPSVLFQPSLTVLSLSVGLTIFYSEGGSPIFLLFFYRRTRLNVQPPLYLVTAKFSAALALTGLNTLYGTVNLNKPTFSFRAYPTNQISRFYPISLTVIFGISIDLLK